MVIGVAEVLLRVVMVVMTEVLLRVWVVGLVMAVTNSLTNAGSEGRCVFINIT